MPLPNGFNDFEFLQDLVRRWQNRIVKEEFSHLGGDEFDPDITVSEQALRHACTIKDNDTAEMVNMRMHLFYFLYGKARDLQPAIYGVPENIYKEKIDGFKTQIYLFFAQDTRQATEGRPAIRAEFHINLEKQISEPTWETEVNQLARRIRQEFASSHPTFTFTKGANIYLYKDKELGHHFKVFSNSESEATTLFKKMLAIQGQAYEETYLSVSNPKKTSQNNPAGTVLAFGKRRKKRRWRPVGDVRFRWATLQSFDLDRDIVLVDTTGSFKDALVRA